MESSPSGLWRLLGKQVGAQVPPGFESLTLRQSSSAHQSWAEVICHSNKYIGDNMKELNKNRVKVFLGGVVGYILGAATYNLVISWILGN